MPNRKTLKDVNSFLDWYKSKMPNEVYLVKNEERYKEIYYCISIITNHILSGSPDAKIEVNQGELDPTAIYLKITTDEIIVPDVRFFATMAKAANVEFYPCKGDKMVMAVLFNGAYDSAPPQDSPFPEFEKGYGKPAQKKTMK